MPGAPEGFDTEVRQLVRRHVVPDVAVLRGLDFLRPWTGRLSDRHGRRIVMVAGASLFALSVVGYLVATSIPVLVAMRLVTGIGDALFFVAALSANVDLAPEDRRGEAMSFAGLSLYVDIGAGPFLLEA